MVVVQELPCLVLRACYVVVCELVASRDPCRTGESNREGTLAWWGTLAISGRNVGHTSTGVVGQHSNPKIFDLCVLGAFA